MIPLNQQPLTKPSKTDSIAIVDMFKTIQGEGPFVGHRSIFLRFAGCNLQCPMCDTDYTNNAVTHKIDDLVEIVSEYAKEDNDGVYLLVITGGEPFVQNVENFCIKLSDRIYHSQCPIYAVQIETNGTLNFADHRNICNDSVHVVCSPKSALVSESVKEHCRYWKYVLDYRFVDKEDGLPTSVLGNGIRPYRTPKVSRIYLRKSVFVQPAETGNPEIDELNIKAAVASCMKFGYRLSLQVHKILGLK